MHVACSAAWWRCWTGRHSRCCGQAVVASLGLRVDCEHPLRVHLFRPSACWSWRLLLLLLLLLLGVVPTGSAILSSAAACGVLACEWT